MSYICKFCKKTYQSRMGLYRHNKECKQEVEQPKQEDDTCKFCTKKLCNYVSKWRHEKICKLNPVYKSDIEKTIQQMQDKIDKLEKNTQSSVTNNNINTDNSMNNSNNTQNVICVFPLGNEPANVLPIEYLCKLINDHGINSVMEIIKKKHFNPAIPECQNFCVTALNNNYASVVDPETKTIKSVNKKDVYDKVYSGVVSNVNQIANPDEKVKETIDRINNIPVHKKMFKKLQCGINEEGYHNRELVKKTWKTAKFVESAEKPAESTRKTIDLNDVSDDSDSDSDDFSGPLMPSKVKPQAKPMDKTQVISQLQKLLDEINKTVISPTVGTANNVNA